MPRMLRRLCLALVLVMAAGAIVGAAWLHRTADARRHYLDSTDWPASGQAAYALQSAEIRTSPGQRPAPIASLAKVMTAYLVLRAAPLGPHDAGFRMRVTARDVADTARRRARDESLVPVSRGEVLTERQALSAVLLPSANNVAVMLAKHVAGSVPAFVARMNATAKRLGMTATHYTDPSGFRSSTVSTARDQTVLALRAMRNPVFASIVDTPSARLPVAGTVHNTDVLLGQDGFVGIKTGSDDAAGGCFMFRTQRVLDGKLVTLTGVVLGQPGNNLTLTGQYAARQLADRVLD